MASQKHAFEASTSEILQLLTHSVYSDKDVFLRELISNASDAIDKARILSLTNTDYLGDDDRFRIRIDFDVESGTIIIDDNGVGMTEKEIIDNIGTIAHSGTKKFVDKLKKSQESHQIGQFGVGFYSSFIIADRVTIDTKTARGKAVLWTSDGKGEYEIDAGARTSRGTTVVLHLSEPERDFANNWKLRSTIQKHSNYIPIPIEMQEIDIEGLKKKDAWEQINETKAIWAKAKSEISEEQYKEFYQSLSFDTIDPLTRLHLNIEGVTSFLALLYIPKSKPFIIARPDEDYGPKLYSKKILILERSKEILPVWLRFVTGVVETSDISLNLSREMLQNNQTLAKIQTNLVKKILEELKKQLTSRREEYLTFFKYYGEILKEGIHYDHELKQSIADAVVFHSLLLDRPVTIQEYVSSRSSEQKDIYYLTGTDLDQLKHSPYVEKIREKGFDVLLMDDPIDEWVVRSLTEYDHIRLVSVASKDLDIDGEEEAKKKEKEKQTIKKDHQDFLARLKTIIGKDSIENVDISDRLTDSPAVLTVQSGGMTPQMEAMMKQMGQAIPASKKTLEINPDHELLLAMRGEFDRDPTSEKLVDMTQYLYDQSILAEGGKLDDMSSFLKLMNKIAKQYLK